MIFTSAKHHKNMPLSLIRVCAIGVGLSVVIYLYIYMCKYTLYNVQTRDRHSVTTPVSTERHTQTQKP